MRRFLLPAMVLAAAVLAPIGASATGTNWKPLQRPLHLPSLAPGGRCPASKIASQINGRRYGVDGAVGPGPVYPMLGRPSLDTVFRSAGWGTWAGMKVLWFVLPDYKGPVLIRGRKLGGSQLMRFDDGTSPPAQIRVAPGETVKWTGQVTGSRGRPSYVRVRVPGCYGVQIDGTSFSIVVVFPVFTSR
ncbi:MAG: hypothetical protein ACYDCH_09350 [Gaiellaceae bacterium]